MTQDEIRLSIINYITYIKSNSLIEMEDICKYYYDKNDLIFKNKVSVKDYNFEEDGNYPTSFDQISIFDMNDTEKPTEEKENELV